MVRPILIPALLVGLCVVGSARAGRSEPEFRRQVESLVQTGKLAYEEGLLVRFQRVFAPDDLPPELRTADGTPAKSATGLIMEYRSLRDGLSARIGRQIEAYLEPVPGAQALVHETPHFRLTYEFGGPHAVDPADENANGVPDHVDRVGAWAELAWSRLFDDAGFAAPSAVPVAVSFREMEAFGYTVVEDGVPRIVLHRSYADFPENLDPEGSARGAAKVSTAHELKHVSQFESSRWSEGGWLEADATWAEDLVFDATDDYLRYLADGSPVSHPDAWLADGVSYGDCLWQHLLAERHGSEILVDFFAQRSARPGESVLASFEGALGRHGSSLAAETNELAVWSYFCGGNASARPVGFDEAAAYPTPPFGQYLAGPAETVSAELAGLATHYVFVNAQERFGRPVVSFVGDRSVPFALHAMTTDTNGIRRVLPVTIPASGDTPTEIELDWAELPYLVVAVTNLGGDSRPDGYFLSVDDAHAVGVDALGSPFRFELERNRPNPFRASTEIAFSLPVEGSVRLAVYDVGGRLVQQLVESERLGAGRHERRWDGLDQSGRFAAPGVYYYRLEAGDRSATRSLLLLR